MNKRLYGQIFINQEELEQNGMFFPIKLEYYKVIDEAKNSKYGIEVIKKEYIDDEEIIEIETKENICDNESKVDEILKILKDYEVTPIGLEDVLCDLIY